MIKYNHSKNKIYLEPPGLNALTFNNYDLVLSHLDDNYLNKGGNSFVFKAMLEEKGYAIKICKFPNDTGITKQKKRIERFLREINALKKAKSCEDVIKLCDNSEIEIYDNQNKTNRKFLCYLMEMGEMNLKKFRIEEEPRMDKQNKFFLCLKILKTIQQLHGIGIYHRDIKPENIFLVNESFKIGDLGLAAYRDEDSNERIDEHREKIGSFGWLSPEVMNKYLAEESDLQCKFDCKIDDKSDIFQLGKLFWFIFQGNVPIGQLQNSDFYFTDQQDIYPIIISMLQYSKTRRLSLDQIESSLQSISHKFSA